jgi:REP element-mobilizing transposase RayT
MQGCKSCGFSHGPFVYASGMRLAPQETRTYLVIAVTAERRSLFQVTATAELLERTIHDYHGQGKFLLHAFVIMPDHFHVLITPAADVSLEKPMPFIKGGFSFRLKSKHDIAGELGVPGNSRPFPWLFAEHSACPAHNGSSRKSVA